MTNGHIDDVDVKHIRQWEADFLAYLQSAQPALLETIRTKKALDDALTGQLKAAVAAFKPLFRAA